MYTRMCFVHYDGRWQGANLFDKEHRHLYCIYRLQFRNMSYIGQTNCTKTRFIKHRSTRADCRFIHNIIKKYGWESIQIYIIRTGLTLEQANTLETLNIKLFNTLAPNGYNLTMGGDSRTPSEETKKLTSKSMKEHWKNGPKSKNNDRDAKRLLMTSLWLNEEFRHTMYNFTSNRMKELWSTTIFRTNQSNKMKDVWANVAFKYKMYSIFTSDEYTKKLSLKQTARFSTIEGKEAARISHSHMRKFTDEEVISANIKCNGSVKQMMGILHCGHTAINRAKKRLGLCRPWKSPETSVKS